ncbi:MAG: glycosyltransferase [Chloroherpetonaceae bacterium]|nr:glycosyltransferase [Chloroherpetonaceae bacterium]
MAIPVLFFPQVLVGASLLVFLGIVFYNLGHLKFLKANPNESQISPSSLTTFPKVSILIPARNEEAVIENCIRSLATLDYPNFEIIALNDHSSDKTGAILDSLSREVNNLTVINGLRLPEGWMGKCWACHQLFIKSSGELLLFTDADTIHHPHSLKRAVTTLFEEKADMLTAIPFQIMNSFWEKQGVPLIHLLIMAFLPLAQIWRSKNEAFAFACGQYLLFTRIAYERSGGHESVKNALVEDVWLVKQVKRSGGKPMVFNGIDAVSCRMYDSFEGVWKGFSKNLFAGVGYNTLGMIAILSLFAVIFLSPIVTLIALSIANPFPSQLEFIPPVLNIIIALLIRTLIAWRFQLPVISQTIYPISIMLFIGIGFNSIRWIKFGSGAEWKGRTYNFSKN